MPGTWHLTQPMRSDRRGLGVKGFFFVVVLFTIGYCLCICVIFIQGDWDLEFYCTVTLDDDNDLVPRNVSWQLKGKRAASLCLAIKQRKGERMIGLIH